MLLAKLGMIGSRYDLDEQEEEDEIKEF